MPRRRDPLIVLGVCFLPYIATAIYSLVRGNQVADYTSARTIAGIAFELAVGIGSLLYLHHRGFPMRVFRVPFSFSAVIIGGLLGLALIPLTGAVYAVALQLPGFAKYGVHEFHNSAPFAVTLLFLVVNSWFEESFVLALPVETFSEWPAARLILFTMILRASYHVYLGPAGVIVILVFGFVLAVAYRGARDLAIPIVAHTVMNVVLSAWRH